MNHHHPENLTEAILQTVIYADLFDYPVTLAEIHHFLIGFNTTIDRVDEAIQNNLLQTGLLVRQDELYFLPGRENLVEIRRTRNKRAEHHWRQAFRYGKWITHIPFVRMVTVTGALASNNVEEWADLDYMIVTQPDFLWLCRAMVLLLVRLTAPFGANICPNYIITTNVLALEERNLFSAQELSRMVPISGYEVYRRFREVNDWSSNYLPNAQSAPRSDYLYKPGLKPLQMLGEFILGGALGKWLSRWEMNRKIDKFANQSAGHPETEFNADVCKGHFDQHGTRILSLFVQRMTNFSEKRQ